MLKKETYITSFAPAQAKGFDLDESIDWMRELLIELNSELTKDELDELGEETFLCFEGTALRRTTGKLEDHLKIDGKLTSVFGTRCIQTGQPMLDNIDIEVKIVAVDHELIERYGYQDQTTLFVDEGEYELYPTKDNRFDLFEAIHEFIWLNKEPYPTLEESSL
jgi:hypothetical protein